MSLSNQSLSFQKMRNVVCRELMIQQWGVVNVREIDGDRKAVVLSVQTYESWRGVV